MSTTGNDHFRRVDAVFDAAVDLPTPEQTTYVESVCGDDPVVRAEVLELLQAHYRTGGLLDSPAGPLSPRLLQALDPKLIGPEKIGPFKIVRAIGLGGMGQVYLGERADGQFEQRVAIKVIRYPAGGLVRRFLEERRILASLEHPNIARLVDGGLTDDGLPYFAMEYVDGEPIDEYCEARRLPLEDRLALFTSVCTAVGYAHQHLIIHRDLKPSNILVTSTGQVKLLDFGIAKLKGPSGGAPRDETRTGIRVMTPDVAAPEQVLGQEISTATDVYALGVLLYQLVAGQRPYDLTGISAPEIERLVCQVVPPPPSAVGDPGLRRWIKGDLDLIVMTALQKAPSRRYQSPAALAEDVERFLEGQPIAARPDSVGYRVTKFVARHRVGVAVVALAVAGLIAGVTRERGLRQRAESAAAKARAVESFLVETFGDADPFGTNQVDAGAVTARDLLDRGVKRVDSGLVNQPEVQAELRTALGRVFTSLGLYDRATPLLERALAQRRTLGDEPALAASMDALGNALAQQDRQPEAEALLRGALARRRAIFGNRSVETAESVEHLATFLEDRNQLAAAESLHREALAIRRTLFGENTIEVASSINNLGLVRYRRGAYAEAESLYRRALAIDGPLIGNRHPLVAMTMQNLAQTLDTEGRDQEAERYYRESLAAKRAILGDAHPSVTIGLNNLGNFLSGNLGRSAEGEALIREAIALDTKIFGPRHTYVAEGLRNLGLVLRDRGDFTAADSALRAALTMDRGLLGPRDQRIATITGYLAHVRYQMGDDREAIQLFRDAYSQYLEFLGDRHFNTLVTMANLARILVETGEPREAESLARASLEKLDTTVQNHRTQATTNRRILGSALVVQRRIDEGLPLLERALAESRQLYGEDAWRTAMTKLWYGRGLLAGGQREEAASMLRAADAVLRQHRVDQPRLAADAARAVASLGPGR